MTSRSLLSAGLVAALVLSVAACGGSDDSSGTPGATVPADVDLTVDAGPGLKWDRESYTVAAGDVSVAVVNRDAQLHTFVIVDGDKTTQGPELEVAKSGDIDTGSYTLAAGTYQILCLVPGHNNMKATLTVE